MIHKSYRVKKRKKALLISIFWKVVADLNLFTQISSGQARKRRLKFGDLPTLQSRAEFNANLPDASSESSTPVSEVEAVILGDLQWNDTELC